MHQDHQELRSGTCLSVADDVHQQRTASIREKSALRRFFSLRPSGRGRYHLSRVLADASAARLAKSESRLKITLTFPFPPKISRSIALSGAVSSPTVKVTLG